MPARRAHRPLVALPAFIALVAFSTLEGAGLHLFGATVLAKPPRAAVIVRADKADAAVASPRGLAGTLAAGGEASVSGDRVDLAKGTLLLAAEGLGTVIAGPVRALAFAGGISVVRDGDRVTVAALTSPALVRSGDALVLVPVGFQWKSGAALASSAEDPSAWLAGRALQPLPAQYRARQLKSLLALRITLSTSALDDAALAPLLASAFNRDTAAIKKQLVDAPLAQRLANASAADAGLLASQLRGTDLLLRATTPFLRFTDIRTLLAVHPGFRDAAWVAEGDTDAQGRLARLFLLPASDTLPDAASRLVIDRWSKDLSALVAEQEDPAPLLTAFLGQMKSAFAAFDRAVLPERSARYAKAIAGVVQPHGSALTAADRALVDGWLRPKPAAKAVAVLPSFAAASSAPTMTPQQAIANVRAALEKAGAMVTKKTAITAEVATAVRVEHVALATAKGDQLVSFAYDAVADDARGIDAAGRTQPFGLPLARYLDWVKRMGVAD